MRQNTFNRRELITYGGAGAFVALAGCASGDSGSDSGYTPTADAAQAPPVKLLTDYNSEPWQEYWTNTVEPGFNQKTGIKTDIEFVGYAGTGDNRLATLMQSGNPPDLFTTTLQDVGDLLSGGQLDSVNDTNAQIQSETGEIIPNLFTDNNDNRYIIPHGYYTYTTVYRQDVYDELDLSVPETFEELKMNAKAVDESDLNMRGIAVATEPEGLAKTTFQYLLQCMGVDRFRWKSGSKNEAEVWFPKAEVLELTEYITELFQYSPTGLNWGPVFSGWGAGQFAHVPVMVNGYVGSIAAEIDEQVARNTGVVHMPLRRVSKEETMLPAPRPDGYTLFSNGSNTQGARAMLKYLYGRGIEETAKMYSVEPARHLPAYQGIIESEAYRNLQSFQDFPSHLEIMEYCQNTVGREYMGNNRQMRPTTGPTEYATRFPIEGELINEVLAAGRDPEAAYDDARQKLEERLQEGKSRWS